MSGRQLAWQSADRGVSIPSPCTLAAGRDLATTAWPASLLGVQALVFDMGDVLYDATLWRRWLMQLLHRLGYPVAYREFFGVWDRQFLDAVHRGCGDYQQAFEAFLESQGFQRGLIDEIVAVSQTRKREIAASLRPLPGVRSTLAELRDRGFSMAVLSDSESTGEELRRRLESLGIGDCFRAVISSFDLRATKPAAAAYQAALAALGGAACETAFVGHDADELDGAAAAGMPTIAINHECGVQADVELKRFEQLLSLPSPCRLRVAARKSSVTA